MQTRSQIRRASRDQLVEFMESRGFQCYDHEKVSDLRRDALLELNLMKREEREERLRDARETH